MERLLEHKAVPLERDELGYSALTYAAAEGREKLAQMMVDMGAKVSIADFASRAAFIKARAGGHRKTAEILIKAGNLGEGKSIIPPPDQVPREATHAYLEFIAQAMEDEGW